MAKSSTKQAALKPTDLREVPRVLLVEPAGGKVSALALLDLSKKRGNGAAKDAGHGSRNSAGASCPTPLSRNSFSGDTTVLMADGSRKPIQEIELGDKVLATNPLTGETAAKEVTDVRSYRTEATLYEVHVGTDTGVGKIVATDEHPFWVPTVGRWVGTEDLKPGYRFLTADNRPATVLGKRTFAGSRLVYNLTVDGLHTYFVGAAGWKTAAADLLVHNDDPEISFATTCDIAGLQRVVDGMKRLMTSRSQEGTTVGGLLVVTASGRMGIYATGARAEITDKQINLAESDDGKFRIYPRLPSRISAVAMGEPHLLGRNHAEGKILLEAVNLDVQPIAIATSRDFCECLFPSLIG